MKAQRYPPTHISFSVFSIVFMIGYELVDGFGSDVKWDIANELQLGLEINHK
jgi:hypothetical protein